MKNFERMYQWVPETTCGDLVTKWIEFLITREDSKTQSSDAKVSKMSLKIKGHAYKILRCKEVSNGLKWLMCIESYSIIFKTKGKNVPYEFAKTHI